MKKLSIVVAMNNERVIGVDNQLPWHIPEDLAYFKKVTLGNPIIMGRKTFESIGRVLPGRRNIVISRNDYKHDGIEVFHSLEDALNATFDSCEVNIIGGGEIFKQALPLVNSMHITIIDYPVDNPTVFFPEVDLSSWNIQEFSEVISDKGIKCIFTHYTR
ncbi:MAG: dihydrofolate reductase [Burkholderiales bacterium]|nr:dihydrofolate reductase [Burkholderiales bacterium]